MHAKRAMFIGASLLSFFVLMPPAQSADGNGAQKGKPVMITRFFTGPDVITLSGHAELVLSGGQTIQVGPGSIELAEDLTGKGHITRTVGTEDRVAILIPVSGP